MYYDPFITAINTQKAAMGMMDIATRNISNLYTPGYRQVKTTFNNFLHGVEVRELPYDAEQGKTMPGQAPTNMMVEGKGLFMVRKPDGKVLFTRLGDFKFSAEGTLVNEAGYKLQGYLLGEDGKVIDTMDAEQSTAINPALNPPHSKGGPGHIPTTEINLWVDPSNGKYFGKYDEYKVKADGTVMGIANNGKVTTPLYKIALANFTNPGGLAQPEDNFFVPTIYSGEPLEGDGEIRSGYLEKSTTDGKEQAQALQMAKNLIDISNKIIQSNKGILDETLRLLQ
jgi:flagellar hook protein FlgE